MKYKLILLALTFPILLSAQLNENGVYLGGRIGLHHSPNIPNLPASIIPSTFSKETYIAKENGNNTTMSGGMTFCWQLQDEAKFLGLQFDLLLSKHKGGYHYSEPQHSTLEYDMTFNYLYTTFAPSLKLNLKGFFFRPGLAFGWNLTPENISYNHTPEEIFGESEYVEQELKLFLKGKDFLSPSVGCGYEWTPGDGNLGLGFELKWYKSFGDVLGTTANPYNFPTLVENKVNAIELTFYFLGQLNGN